MKKKIAIYFAFVLFFVVCRLGFMFFHGNIYGAFPVTSWLQALWYGLPHDLAVAAYLMIIPFSFELVRIFVPGKWHNVAMRIYFSIVLIPVLLLIGIDMVLYSFWGFRLDTTPMIYLTDNPVHAIEQSPTWALIASPILITIMVWALQKPLGWLFPARKKEEGIRNNGNSSPFTLHLSFTLVVLALLWVAIHGGFSTKPMSLGRVYFSEEMRLNHAATNPLYSFIHSLERDEDFGSQYRFMSDEECKAAMAELEAQHPPKGGALCSSETPPSGGRGALLRTQRPNIVFLLLESFSGSACHAIEPEADPAWMPSVNALYDSAVAFTNFYANSFRTDRGIAAVLASYPGQPCYTVMKNPAKADHLDYLTLSLKRNGYANHFIHGGDSNFTNLKGFLKAGGVDRITQITDFSEAERTSKFGAPDHVTFSYLYKVICEESEAQLQDSTVQPFCKVYISLSSHEPFDVPYHHFEHPFVNSIAYSDSCIGALVDSLKATPYWDNLLIIGVADHCHAQFPETIQNHEIITHHIPMFWTGGAITGPRRIDTMGTQVDISATLLTQMGIEHDEFGFSHDIMDPTEPHYAFYTWPDGFGFLTDSVCYIQDNEHDGYALPGSNDPHGTAERWGKASLQSLFDDLARR